MSQAFHDMRLPEGVIPNSVHAPHLNDERADPFARDARSDVWPEYHLELAALLEAEGVTDAVAATLGSQDVFELTRNEHGLRQIPVKHPASREQLASRVSSKRFLIKNLLRGPLMFLIVGFLLAGIHFYQTTLQSVGVPAWSILLGLTVGTIIANAFTQGLAWGVSLAMSQGVVHKGRKMVLHGLLLGGGIAALTTVLLMVCGKLLALPAAALIGVGVSCMGIMLLLLMIGMAVLLKRGGHIIPVFAIVGGAAWLTYNAAPGPLTGMTILSYSYLLLLCSIGVLTLLPLFEPTAASSNTRHQLPPFGQMVYKALPYVMYGGLLIIYVTIGQYGTWLADLPLGWNPVQVASAPDIYYYLGTAAVLLTLGISEHALHDFWQVIPATQQKVGVKDEMAIRGSLWQFLIRHVKRLVIAQVVINVVIGGAAALIWDSYHLSASFGPLMPTMLVASLVGYGLLAVGFLGCAILVTLTRAWLAAFAMFVAIITQSIVTMTLGPLINFDPLIAGVIVGGLCFVTVVYLLLAKLLRRADYVLYQVY